MGARIVSIYTGTDEHYRKDETKCFFAFYDDEKKLWHSGAITYEKLFELLKPYLAEKSEP
jgi:hypothetical protein